jgi:apolipoprotein N-acyltransferase
VGLGLYARIAWPWAALGWVTLAPWLAVLDRARGWRATVAVALGMTVVFELVQFGWFAEAMHLYTATPWALALALLVLASPLLQPQLVALALARHALRRRAAGAVRLALTGACVWVGTEWACPKLLGDTLGYPLWPSLWMRQGADVAGVSGLTFVLLLANEAALVAGRGLAARRWKAAGTGAGVIAVLAGALLAYGALRTRHPSEGKPLRVGIVQADVSRYGRMAAEQGTFGAVETILIAHEVLSRKLLRRESLDLLVWPETVYPTTFGVPKSADGAAFDRALAGFVGRVGVPLIFGAYDGEDGVEFNAAVFLDPPRDGRVTFETYRKAALFPLTERVPAWLDGPHVRRWLPWLGTWSPGGGGDVVAVALPDGRTLRVVPLICYDVLAPALARAGVRAGGELIVTLSNDAWFGSGPAAWQHLIGAAFRSVETRRAQVRATNTGISAVIDAQGSITAMAGIGERAVLSAPVIPEAHAVTPVLRLGDWLGPLALVAGLGLVVAAFAHRETSS